MHRGFLLLSLLVLSPLPVLAHNGAVAVVMPVKDITIDGDLSDWPQDMRRYPILLPEWGDAPKDSADFQASFRLGYSTAENALWVAVEVQDESFVVVPTGGSWDNQDGCEIYVDLAHQEQNSPATQYNLYGRERSVFGPGANQGFEVEVRQEGKMRCYEWRIDAGRMHLHAGQVVGLDVVVEDQDQEGSFSWMAWGREGEKVNSTDRRGDALRVLYNQYKKYDLNLVEEYGEGLPSVQGNFAQLGQVCMNLIKNAIEALKGMEGQITLKTYAADGQVVFECADTGPGIAEEVRQNIFKPFFTTKAPGEGTGLGLYICHQTVEKHRGTIEVESEVGKGTRFRVKLPASST